MTPRKEELQGAGWKTNHGLGGDASYMPAWLKRCIFKVIVLDVFVVFLQWLGNASSEGKSVCAGVTATNFWLNFLRANDYFFPANWGLYDFFFLKHQDIAVSVFFEQQNSAGNIWFYQLFPALLTILIPFECDFLWTHGKQVSM